MMIRDHPFVAIGVFVFYVILLKLVDPMINMLKKCQDTVIEEYTKFVRNEAKMDDAFYMSVGAFVGTWIVMGVICVLICIPPVLFFHHEMGQMFLASMEESWYFRTTMIWGFRYIYIFGYAIGIWKFWKWSSEECTKFIEKNSDNAENISIYVPSLIEMSLDKIKSFRHWSTIFYIIMNVAIYLHIMNFMK